MTKVAASGVRRETEVGQRTWIGGKLFGVKRRQLAERSGVFGADG